MPDASYLILINGQAIHTLEIKVHEEEEDEKKKEGNAVLVRRENFKFDLRLKFSFVSDA